MTEPRIVATPADAMIDVPRAIRAEGFAARAPVEMTARLTQNDGTHWRSRASFIADARGAVDVARTAPLAGSYAGVSPMGLVWSMRPTGGTWPPRPLVAPINVELVARGADNRTAQGGFTQTFLAPGVTRSEICEGGMVGTLFTPPGAGPHRVLMVLAGSGGGLMEARAALFAAHGLQALALGYFNVPGLKPTISETPLEYFESALRWMHETLRPAGDHVSVCGVSRGGELALLLGATFPDLVNAVVAYVPSPFTHGVLNAGRPGEDRHAPSWTYGGVPLPVLSRDNTTVDWDLFDKAPSPRSQSPAFLSALDDPAAAARAMIPLERIAGPVLLISGSDDGLWPSERFSEIAEERLLTSQHRHAVRHLRNAQTGHSIGFPYVPTTVLARPHPVSGIMIRSGGTEAGNARANEAHWPEVLRFLNG
jgi:pimeloyl-ACP methyl ester carboxylesterase